MRLIAGADALQEGDLVGMLVIGGALDVTEGGAGSRQQPLELQRGDHVGITAVAQLLRDAGVVGLVARSQDDGSHVQRLRALHHVVVNGIDAAGVPAAQALGAETAGQATRRLRLRQFVRVAPAHLLEAAQPLIHLRLGHALPRRQVNLAPV